MKLNRYSVVLLVLPLISGVSCKEQRYPDALTPEQAVESFEIHDDFKVEVFAAEPDVLDPIEMVFDDNGDAYVVEMPDYPYMPDSAEANGRIRILRDTDGDGKIDQSSIFADKLLDATSVLPWKGGLIVTAAPHILYLKDTDGDFKADSTEVLFSGFFENNSEAQITSLRFNVDNWIYATNHGQAGEVNYTKDKGGPTLSMRGSDFRFRLDREEFELAAGHGQFGQSIDDWGHRFLTQNTIHIQQAVVPKRYLLRHSHLPSGRTSLNVSDHDLEMFQITPPPYWRAERTKRRNKRYQEQNLDRVEYAEDHFTGSSGGTIYAGDAFPEEFYGNVFTAEVAGNLVHRDVLKTQEDSPAYIATRAKEEMDKEFLATKDSWFRPTGFTLGPDGYLYVTDMYRQHIETHLSIPEDLQEDMDYSNGKQHGRIYRILPKNSDSSEKKIPNLRDMNTSEYVELLSHPNRWWRLRAQRLLLERQDKNVLPAVKEMFTSHKNPKARLHALYVLEGLNALSADLVKEAVKDAHPGVREHGIILAERFPELLPELIESVNDPSMQVAFQAALSVGQFNDPKVEAALAKVIEKNGQDPWFRTAVLSSEAGSSIGFMEKLADNGSILAGSEPWKTTFIEDLSYIIGSRNQEKQILSFLNLLSKPSIKQEEGIRASAVAGLTKGLKKSEKSAEIKEVLQHINVDSTDNTEKAIQDLKNYYSKSRNI